MGFYFTLFFFYFQQDRCPIVSIAFYAIMNCRSSLRPLHVDQKNKILIYMPSGTHIHGCFRMDINVWKV